MLNAIIESDSPIKDVELKNTDLEKEHLGDKFCRLDIKAKTDKGGTYKYRNTNTL
ncbi:PD-(D/E)XK nuclease family transposase [Clostridium perfringens]|uniref:PD-(D/E)XK nuclease family transposase n=1 Tax=Clostridium perfringens TaxID=1502 RepID=UPI003D2F68CA